MVERKKILVLTIFGVILISLVFFLLNPINFNITGFTTYEETIEKNPQAFISFVIETIKAERLDSNRGFISDIYDESKALDDIWSEPIQSGDYVRVTFEENLSSKNDITIYPKIIDGEPRIEVYEADKTEVIAEFTDIISNDYNKVLLTNLQGSQDIFDLLVLEGSLEFDYIFDPTGVFYDDFESGGFAANWEQDAQGDWAEGSTYSSCGSTYSAEAEFSTNGWLRVVNNYSLVNYLNANVTASLQLDGTSASGEYLCMDFSCDGGVTWNNDTTSDGGVGGLCQDGDVDTEDVWREVSLDIKSACGSLPSNFKVRFRHNGGNNDFGFVDCVNITGFGTVDMDYPLFSNPTENPPEPVTYSQGATYEFNITITSTNGTAGLDFDSTNYTASNLTASLFNVSITDLEAGNHTYYWWSYGNGSSNNYNISVTYSYNITKATGQVNLSLNGAEDNLTIQYPQQSNITASTDYGTVTIYRDGTVITSENALNVTRGGGYYNITAVSSGNQNYSSASKTYWLNITKAENPLSLLLNGNAANLTIQYPQQLNASASSSGGTIKIFMDGVDVTNQNAENVTLGAGYYTYMANATGDQNYTDNSTGITYYANITQASSSINLTLNNTQGNISVYQGDSIDLNCSTLTGDSGASLKLYKNGTLINRGTSPLGNTTTFDIIQVENITCVYNESQNYTQSSETWWVNVTAVPDSINPNLTIISPGNQTYSTVIILFNISAVDNVGISSCEYSINGGTTNYSMTQSGDYWSATNSSMSQGSHTVNFYCNDTSNRMNNTEQETFFVDSIPPYFIDNTPQDQTITYGNDLSYDINATDAGIGLDSFTVNDSRFKINISSGLLENNTILGVKEYYLNITINDTLNNLNSTVVLINITKATPSGILINYTSRTLIYPNPVNISFSESNTGDADITYKLFRNEVDVTSENAREVVLGAGTYNYTLNTTGGQNYSANASMANFTVTVTQNSSYVLSLSITPSTTEIYPTSTTATGSGCPSELICNLTLNITGIVDNPNTITLGVGIYNYTYNTTGNTNYSINTVSSILTISQNTSPVVYAYLNNTRSNITIYNDTSIWLNGTLFNVTGTLKLYKNGTLINQGSSPLSNYTSFLQVGLYNITGIYEGNENYSSASETWWVNSTEAPSDAFPTISIVYPGNTTYKINVTGLNYTASDDISLGACWYSTNEGATNSSPDTTCSNLTDVISTENSNIWTVWVNDSIGQESSDSVTFFKDTINPEIEFVDPTTQTGNYSQNYVIANITASDSGAGLDTITVSLYNSTGLYNSTTSSSSPFYINFSNLPDETYYLNATVNDSANNDNSTATRTIILDTQGPQVTSLTESPSDPVNYSQGIIYEFNATITDPTLSVILLDFNGTNYSASNIAGNVYNVSISDLGAGSYSYYWYANDTYGNVNNSENGTYTINQAIPNLSLTITPSTTEIYPTSTTATGSGCPSQLTCKLYRNGVEVTNGQNITLGVGVYNYTFNTTGNTNYTGRSISDLLNITIATGVVYTYVNNGRLNISIDQYSSIWLNGTLASGQTGNDIKLYKNGTLINQGTSPSNLTQFNNTGLYNITTIYEGNENYTFASETWWVNVTEVDTTNPDISIVYPSNNTNTTNPNIDINYTISDNNAIDSCWYSNDTYSVNTSLGSGGSCLNITTVAWSEGEHNVAIWVNDTRGNENSSSIRFFVDTIKPPIEFVDPTKSDGYVTKENLIPINITALDTGIGLDSITVRLYDSSKSQINSSTTSSSPNYVEFSGLSGGIYYYNATANDSLNNENSTETRMINLTLPTLTILKPENTTYIANTSLLLNYSVSNEDTVWYNIDLGENTTISSPIYFNTTEGNHILYLYSNNSNGIIQKNITFNVNSTKFQIYYDEFQGSNKGDSTNFNEYSYLEIQNLSGIVLENTQYGKIEFNDVINLTDDLNLSDDKVDLDEYINISNNRIEINSDSLPNLNKNATLYLYGLSFSSPQILKDGVLCSAPNCVQESYSGGTLKFNVTGFTVYSARETPSGGTSSGGGGGVSEGGGPSVVYECFNDSVCEKDEVCWNNKCVKLFDIKITDFESPVKLGEFFDFTYFIKGMANISGDVEVQFWIEKEENVVTSGSDTIYLGSFEEKTEVTKIFLPSTVESGTYTFFIQVVYGGYKAKAHRTIEIEVKDEVVTITPVKKDYKTYLIFILLCLVILMGGVIVLRKRRVRTVKVYPVMQEPKKESKIGNILKKISHNVKHQFTSLKVKYRTRKYYHKQIKEPSIKIKKIVAVKPIAQELKQKEEKREKKFGLKSFKTLKIKTIRILKKLLITTKRIVREVSIKSRKGVRRVSIIVKRVFRGGSLTMKKIFRGALIGTKRVFREILIKSKRIFKGMKEKAKHIDKELKEKEEKKKKVELRYLKTIQIKTIRVFKRSSIKTKKILKKIFITSKTILKKSSITTKNIAKRIFITSKRIVEGIVVITKRIFRGAKEKTKYLFKKVRENAKHTSKELKEKDEKKKEKKKKSKRKKIKKWMIDKIEAVRLESENKRRLREVEEHPKRTKIQKWMIDKIEAVRLESENKRKKEGIIKKIEDKRIETNKKKKKENLKDSDELLSELFKDQKK